MDLILIRHGKAFERDAAAWPDDARRPLTLEGREEFARLARRLGRLRRNVDLVESSGFVRAWQTAQLLGEHASWPNPARLEALEASEGSETPEGFRAQLEALTRTVAAMARLKTVVWVGHEPIMSCLASQLLGQSPDAVRIDFKKGAAMALRIDGEFAPRREGGSRTEPQPRAQLLWMVTPAFARARKT